MFRYLQRTVQRGAGSCPDRCTATTTRLMATPAASAAAPTVVVRPRVASRRSTAASAQIGDAPSPLRVSVAAGQGTYPMLEPNAQNALPDELDPEMQTMDPEHLCELVLLYLRTCRAPTYVSPYEEAKLFPMLISRMEECSYDSVLAISDTIWPRTTRTRYGERFKVAVREKILRDASSLEADRIAQIIIVLGMGTGFSRDLELFERLGKLLVHKINDVKDADSLVDLLGSLARSKIAPPPSFLALLGRRFPVLNKKKPLSPDQAYRAFANFYKMEYPMMNPYRFFADRILNHVLSDLKAEKKGKVAAAAATATTPKGPATATVIEAPSGETLRISDDVELDDDEDVERTELGERKPKSPEELKAEREARRAAQQRAQETLKAKVAAENLVAEPATNLSLVADEALTPKAIARQRFKRITQLKPSQFVKMLWILSRLGAPRQQYLRPVSENLILPMVPYFNPPTFSKLIRAMRNFGCDDKNLIRAVLDRMVALGPEKCVLADVVEALRMLGVETVPIEPTLALSTPDEQDVGQALDPRDAKPSAFYELCRQVFSDDSKLRARDMISIAGDLMAINRRIPLVSHGSTKPLLALLETFASRMAFLLDLGVLSLSHAEMLLEMCQTLKVPDTNGHLAALRDARKRVNEEGEEEYYSQVDIDVREIFFRTQILNNFNTYGAFRPLPANLFVEYRQLLETQRADYILEAVHLYHQAYPGCLKVPMLRVLSRFLRGKLSESGMEEVVENGLTVMKPVKAIPFTVPSLTKFVNMLAASPLGRLRRDPATWAYCRREAEKLAHEPLLEKIESVAAQCCKEKEKEKGKDKQEEKADAADEAETTGTEKME